GFYDLSAAFDSLSEEPEGLIMLAPGHSSLTILDKLFGLLQQLQSFLPSLLRFLFPRFCFLPSLLRFLFARSCSLLSLLRFCCRFRPSSGLLVPRSCFRRPLFVPRSRFRRPLFGLLSCPSGHRRFLRCRFLRRPAAVDRRYKVRGRRRGDHMLGADEPAF